MKKLIILTIFTIIMISCNDELSVRKSPEKLCEEDYQTIVIDSCEYLKYKYRVVLAHKGNCKYCTERQKLIIEKREK